MFDTDRQTAQGRFHYRHRNPTPASLLKAKRFITVKDCSDGAIAIAIFLIAINWLCRIQCKCLFGAIASCTLDGTGNGTRNDGFLYYAFNYTHYTRTGTAIGNHCFLLCTSRSLSLSGSPAVCVNHKSYEAHFLQ